MRRRETRRSTVRYESVSVVTCALTGGVHTPSMSPALPISADDMIRQGKDAVAAGAAVLHVHARNPIDGRPDPRPSTYEGFVPALHDETDAIINITTGGSTSMTLEERLAAAVHFEPELASLNLGSINFVFSAPAKRDREWKFDWERDYLLSSEDAIFSNTYRQIESTIKTLGDGCGTRFEFECYDVGHLYTLDHFAKRGVVKPPFLIQMVMGVQGGIGAEADHLLHLVRTADRLFGTDYYLSAFGAGRKQIPMATQSLLLGGNVRVGLEDNLFIGPGELAPDNASQVSKIVAIMAQLGVRAATPTEVRDLLHLKGRGNTRIAA
ncbi:3-keto-5-aminohexanoate cleavage protein [Pseudarthrobacter sulfonivorans]|uniref:3-keto-5-aminohexanoate cleavage protein n=1 Tax=Pseudarthrobacter sulfonivorans TaxID=121292 RepID=A0A0U3Q6H6_9MICC|nr:3-keto-5-aminohexanoate cleavage protein [Pseudarthrobacter sulfonivorans]ALV39901.1 3-keto-5-aminohexanoate cleavage protein [Pseudarthrobacter sulfonivorans]